MLVLVSYHSLFNAFFYILLHFVETTNLTLLGLSEQDLAEVVGYIDSVFYVVEELIKTRKKITESNPRYSELLEFKLADDIKKEVKCFCNFFIT